VNKLLLSVLFFLLANNCSFLPKEKPKNEIKKSNKIILSKQLRIEQELNPEIEIQISQGKFNTNHQNNQNNIGELEYQGLLEKKVKFKFSKFDDFEYVNAEPIFYNDKIIYFDNKGTIILYDQNQKVIWKKNFYKKSEKKSRPRLNLANKKNILIVTDNVAKYYAVDIETGNIIWEKNNNVPFNSDIKVKGDFFYVVDFKNILRSISVIDGSVQWSLKTEESLTKSNTKISIVTDKKNIYFNNSIGDITAVNIKTGQLIWQLPTQSNDIDKNAFQLSNSKLVINQNSIFFSNNKSEFYSIDIDTGLINWKNEINSDLRPIIIDRYIITISNKGYLYIIDKELGNILRINALLKEFKNKKKKPIKPVGFFVGINKIYLTKSDGKLAIINLSTGKILENIKISGGKISQPFINLNKLFLIRNGSIIKFN
jgi:outer membrane protein assembly factor BamB